MTERQLQFAKSWMGLLGNNPESILHQISIKKDFNIPGVSERESEEIWDAIKTFCNGPKKLEEMRDNKAGTHTVFPPENLDRKD